MDKLVSDMHKQIDSLKNIIDDATNVYKQFVLISMKQDLEKIDKSDLVAFLIDPNQDVRALAKEEIERRDRIESARANKRAWYRALLDRVRGKLPTRSEDNRHSETKDKSKRKAAREFYRK